MREPCPECGISPDDELTQEAYEVLWDAIPELRAAQDSGEKIRCSECGRRLTFGEGGGSR
jgi:hypothetical protein